jgi:site-specific recombinase XerD
MTTALAPNTLLLNYYNEHYFTSRHSDRTREHYRTALRRLDSTLGRPATLADLNEPTWRRLEKELNRGQYSSATVAYYRGIYLAVWRHAADRGILAIGDDHRRQRPRGPKPKPWPKAANEATDFTAQTPLADFIRACCLDENASRKTLQKFRLLIDHLSAALDRSPTVADLKQFTLAALTYRTRNKQRLSLTYVGKFKQYFRSVWRVAAEMGLVPDLPRAARIGGRKAARQKPLTARLKARITTAVTMRAQGKDWKAIARHFKLTPESIWGWRKRHRDFWNDAFDEAMRAEVARLKDIAGSPKLIEVPDFARMAERCEQWAATQGQTIFPAPSPEVIQENPTMHTVPSFLESYMVPCCLTEATVETVGKYRQSAHKFAITMGNPPLCKITNLTLASYRDILRKMPARGRGGKPLSINTVVMYLSHLQTILDKAGPPVRRSRDAAGYIQTVPWVKRPREEYGEAKIVSDEALEKCYQAAALMKRPAKHPVGFWRGLLVTARYLALRARTLFSMEWKHVDWENRRVVLPAALLKGRKVLVLPMPEVVIEHLLAIRQEHGKVFHWPHAREYFRECFHKLQNHAGIEPSQHFGLHSLRRTGITKLWRKSPAAAQLLAGHGSPIITRLHYVNVEDVLVEAMSEVGSFTDSDGKVGAT